MLASEDSLKPNQRPSIQPEEEDEHVSTAMPQSSESPTAELQPDDNGDQPTSPQSSETASLEAPVENVAKPETPLPEAPPPDDEDTAPLRLTQPPVPPPPFGGEGQPVKPPVKPSTQPVTLPPATPPPNVSSSRPTRPAVPVASAGQGSLQPRQAPRVAPATNKAQPPSGGPPRQPTGTTARPGPHSVTAASPPARPAAQSTRKAAPPSTKLARQQTAAIPARPARRSQPWRESLGCLLRSAFIALFALVVVAFCGVSLLFLQYYRIARTLPDIADLRQRASQFETMRIFDRNGNALYEIVDPNAGRRTYVPLAKISPYLVAATIATEDKGFYSHPGFDMFAILRAFIQNYQTGETVSGASTITQQLARSLLLSPEERFEQTYERKVREAILAAEITRRYSKDEILEIYLNENNYGSLSYGVEAAAETYFQTTADKLTLGQASFLAGLPQAPAVYDVYTNPEAAFSRQRDVLSLMFELSQEQNCIEVSNATQRICVDAVSATKAANEIKEYPFKPPVAQMRYPHWVTYIRTLLEGQFDPQTIYRLGYSVYTTIDPEVQELAQAAVSEQVQSMAAQNAQNGALIAIRPSTGEILAMVGSADFYNENIDGQVNMAISPRQPGSAIKPLTYLAAFEKGWTPATLIWDVPTDFPPSGRPDDPSPPYQPANYDGRFHGPVTVRDALANSYNIPAVKALQYVGIYDDPNVAGEDGLLAFARRLGITSLDQPDYGLSLTLGGGEVSLLDLTSAFSTIANNGRRIPPVAILRIADRNGNVVYEYKPAEGTQVLRPEHAYLITSILSDNRARAPMFGNNSPINLPFPAAAKTGTTNDFRDNWTVGYNPDLAVGAWVGNADYTPMHNTTGLSGAAPIWNRVMTALVPKLTGGNPSQFNAPPGVVERVICAESGTSPSEWCPKQRSELFAIDQPPLPPEDDLWQRVVIDTWTGLRASSSCS
jgi:penicillin-binding protein 1C